MLKKEIHMEKCTTETGKNKRFNKDKWFSKKCPTFKEISFNEFRDYKINPKIALITANDIERDAVLKEMSNLTETLSGKYSIINGAQTYYVAKFGNFPVVMLKLGAMGTNEPSAATLTVQDLITTWKPSIIIAVGVAMGMKPDSQKLGDVLVSKSIFNYNLNKMTDESVIDRSPRPIASVTLHDRFVNCINWKFCREDGSLCKTHSGLIITGGSLVNQTDFTNKLRNKYRDAVGNEMEATGIWAACEKLKKDWIIVKGICDWGEKKVDDFQPLAAAAAVSLCKKVLNNENALDGIVKTTPTKKTSSIKKSNNTRVNSLKLYYQRTQKGISTQELAAISNIQEVRIIEMESFKINNYPFDVSYFPQCTLGEIQKLERVLYYGRKVLEADLKNGDKEFMGYLLSYYYKNKLGKKFNGIKAIVFDFDGTLTRSKTDKRSTWQRIWMQLGYTVNDCNELHLKFSRNEISHQEWCDLTCKMFRDRNMSRNILKEIASEINLVEGCIPILKTLKEENIFLYITSGSIQDVIKDVIGQENIPLFEQIQSNRMEFERNGLLKRIIGTKFDFKGKCSFIEKVANELNIKPYEILFVGNSNNDELAYTSGAITLCVNPHETNPHEANVWNNIIYEMQNLKEILPYVGQIL